MLAALKSIVKIKDEEVFFYQISALLHVANSQILSLITAS